MGFFYCASWRCLFPRLLSSWFDEHSLFVTVKIGDFDDCNISPLDTNAKIVKHDADTRSGSWKVLQQTLGIQSISSSIQSLHGDLGCPWMILLLRSIFSAIHKYLPLIQLIFIEIIFD